MLKSIYFALLSYWAYPILSREEANRTISLSVMRLQNKAVRTIKYDKTKTITLCSKQKILNISDLFILSISKFMFSFDNDKLPNHFDYYFSDIASGHKYQKFVSLKKDQLS